MKSKAVKFVCAGLILLLPGCAGMPKQSVQLSQEVGRGIAAYHQAYTNVLNEYFVQKRGAINRFILDTYLPAYMENIMVEMELAGEDPEKLHPFMVHDVVKDVAAKRDAMQEELEKTRIALIDAVSRDYLLLIHANATITGLLQSAVDVNESAASLSGTIESVSGNQIDFDEVEAKFNEYLLDAGSFSSNSISLYESVKAMLPVTEGE
jgi:hypothetical protein